MWHSGLRRSQAALVLSMLLPAAMVLGEPEAAPSRIEPKADEVLRQMGRCLAEARSFTFEAHDMYDEVLPNGQKIQLGNARRVAVRRPDRVFADLNGDTDNATFWYDGRTVTRLDKQANTYGAIGVPGVIDDMLDDLVERFDMVMPLADLIVRDPYTSATRHLWTGDYVGLHRVQEARCHHLAFRQPGIDWQLWVQADGPPLPRKLVITFKDLAAQPQYIVLIGNWNLNVSLTDARFVFQPPAGAARVEWTPVSAMQRPAAPDGQGTEDD